ncbi:unnamed protein product [Adineta steineri]|uniref:Uncharacterized protein n=1 Tax=Adineta steineri TaxID=433720 RepID=A0A813MKZ3_9BILA|nr:unnamed protein product [Adineta steineri]CAF3975387.1 unnamed protein product [Adineta steineri]
MLKLERPIRVIFVAGLDLLNKCYGLKGMLQTPYNGIAVVYRSGEEEHLIKSMCSTTSEKLYYVRDDTFENQIEALNEISSIQIRQMIKNGQSCEHLTFLSVLKLNTVTIMTSDTSKIIFLAGCGSGYDIFGALPYYFKIKSNVTLINYTFTKHTVLSQYSEQLTTLLFRIDPKTHVPWLINDLYFPEQRLANELQVPIYAILCDYDQTDLQSIVDAYRYLINGRTIDELILIDGGSDVLLTGNELLLGTPVEDMSHARAVDLLSTNEVKSKYIMVIGTNLEVGHGVRKSDIDARLTALSSNAIFTWLWQYEHDDDIRRYVEIFHRCAPRQSIVHSLICAALQGHREYYVPEHLRDRITNSLVELSEETCRSIGYHFDDVMQHNIYFK